MPSISSFSSQMLFNETLRNSISKLNDLPDRVLDQDLSKCILEDMSPLELSDRAVQMLFCIISEDNPEDLSVRDLRTRIEYEYNKFPNTYLAQHWRRIEHQLQAYKNLDEFFEETDFTNLNQLLKYIGGKDIKESYKYAKQKFGSYSNESEYSDISYSLGVNFTYSAVGHTQTGDCLIEYSDNNALRLLSESRFILEHELLSLIQWGDDPDIYASVKINHISMYMNGLEVFSFPVYKYVDEVYDEGIDLVSELPYAKVRLGGCDMKEILFSGDLINKKGRRWLRHMEKGKHLENELGM
ncbi:hypothetical protein [Pseudomonas putida]|uniref:Uncharacterized protein n=1 Tax=Pseudomonas putida TaxID=303 RepID=A0A8I1JI75_PSEPU|nr:hypothetical protein [Pseudomonas putida]MBI6882683.1 hypothetical protein [Pseudomonas putida]